MNLTLNQKEAYELLGVTRSYFNELENSGKIQRLKDFDSPRYNTSQVLSLAGEGKATYMERKLQHENEQLRQAVAERDATIQQIRLLIGGK